MDRPKSLFSLMMEIGYSGPLIIVVSVHNLVTGLRTNYKTLRRICFALFKNCKDAVLCVDLDSRIIYYKSGLSVMGDGSCR
jgi:hypothetical protein